MNIKNILIYILGGCALFFAFTTKLKDRQIEVLNNQNAVLQDGLKRQIIFRRNRIIYKYRPAAGQKLPAQKETKTEVKTYFVPVEGFGEITENAQDIAVIKIKNYGFTFKPFIGVAAGDKITPVGGARLFFYNRWGLGGGFTYDGPALALDRRMDDVLPFDNISLMLLGGYKQVYFGAAVYL